MNHGMYVDYNLSMAVVRELGSGAKLERVLSSRSPANLWYLFHIDFSNSYTSSVFCPLISWCWSNLSRSINYLDNLVLSTVSSFCFFFKDNAVQ